MRALPIALTMTPLLAMGQSVDQLYNRDTHEQFRIKNVKVERTVIGPIVRTSTLMTFENPYKKLTEASLWFGMPQAAALSGFAYYYGDEYVRGQLMDKAKAWFIYTAITSRNRDPGIMDQVSPTYYHAQIYPLMVGRDLRVRLYSVGMVEPGRDGTALPKPTISFAPNAPTTSTLRVVPGRVQDAPLDVKLPPMKSNVQAVAQRFKDGRTYVAGIVRAKPAHKIEVLEAYYEPYGSQRRGVDVTQRLRQEVDTNHGEFRAENRLFGDPFPGRVKQIWVRYRVDGRENTRTVMESATVDLVAQGPGSQIKIPGLRDAKTVAIDQSTYAFMGWTPRSRALTAKVDGKSMSFRPQRLAPGSETAKLWAQQKLAQDPWRNKREVLAFSLKYGVPSTYTALLAVPKQEMELFRKKEKEYQKVAAEQRKRELEEARRQREWAKSHPQNWRWSSGGDPEIRVAFPNAERVTAILPDGRVLNLTKMGDFWGTNFEIPADAREGRYEVRLIATNRGGVRETRSLSYDVDRTPPNGTATVRRIDGKLVLEVRSEAGLAQVAAWTVDGRKLVLKEEEPGVYRLELEGLRPQRLTITLTDNASNKRTLECSWPR